MRRTRPVAALVAALLVALAVVGPGQAGAETYKPVSGAGSTWSQNALDQWIRDVNQFGMQVNYAGTGSSDGRTQFWKGHTVDFAASDIPFQTKPEDGSAPEQPKDFAYMPITAGGTVLMYNLTINGQRVTNLRLSGENVAKIFTGVIKTWDDPAVAADNPNLALPSRPIVPVVRSDGSGSTAQFSLWMIAQHEAIWDAYCKKSGRAPACGQTSYYPTISSMVAQSGDLGVAGYVAQNHAAGAIGYVNYSFALNARFPVVKILNQAGYYTEPTPQNVAVSLLKAEIETQNKDPQYYLTQKLAGVYNNPDPRAYPLSSYSYLILPTKVGGQFSEDQGKTLAAFARYAMCDGQNKAATLGYSPMPLNLVQAGFEQIRKIPGADIGDIDVRKCKNPTFSADGHNVLADTAPQPAACDKQGSTQCTTGTGGAKAPTTATRGATGTTASTTPAAVAGTTGSTTPAGATTPSVSGAGGPAVAGSTGSVGSLGSGDVNGSVDGGACDPSSGACGGDVAFESASGELASSSGPAANPVTLAPNKGWGVTQTMMLVIAGLFLALLFAPGMVARYARDGAGEVLE